MVGLGVLEETVGMEQAGVMAVMVDSSKLLYQKPIWIFF